LYMSPDDTSDIFLAIVYVSWWYLWYLYTLVSIVIFRIQLFFVFINVIFQYFKIWILAITMILNFVFETYPFYTTLKNSEWLLFNSNSAMFQLYHGENKLIFNEMIMRSTLY
jgi:hypothetical protein